VKVLLVKTSSMGDLVHAMPAITEAASHLPKARFTWVVEEAFADIAALHPNVEQVIPVAIRRWRKNWIGASRELSAFVAWLRATKYDLIIDSQGLLKSSLIARAAQGPVHGFDRRSARESLSAFLYHNKHRVDREQHAVHRQKQLFAGVFGYIADREINYGLERSLAIPAKSIMLLHGTTWASKEWPGAQWTALAQLMNRQGYEVIVPSGSEMEYERAQHILGNASGRILDRVPLSDLIQELRHCTGVVSVDTGLGHLAAALGIPVAGLYGSTDPNLTGILGPATRLIVSDHLPCIPCRSRDCRYPNTGDSSNIFPPCYEQTTPETVWQALRLQIGSQDKKLD